MEKNNLLVAAVVGILILGTLGFSQDVFAIQTATPIDTVSCKDFVITESQAHEALDEFVGTPDDDATKISSDVEGATCRVNVGSFEDPVIHTGHTIHFRAQATGGGSGEKIIVKLFDGDIQVAASQKITIDRNFWNDYSYKLPTVDPDDIADYTNLRIELEIDTIGNFELLEITQTYLEVPDKPEPRGNKLAPTDVENFYFLDFPIDITGFTRTTAFGIMSDCTAKTIANNKIEEIPTVDCVFSVDEIRVFSNKLVDDNRVVTFDVLCIDKLKFTNSLEDWNSCSFLTQGDIEMDLGLSIGVDIAIKAEVGTIWHAGGVSGLSLGFNLVSADLPWIVGLPLKNIHGEYRDEFFGGNLLHDSGIGPVKARKFVVVAEEASGQKGSLGVDGRIQFLGKKPHDMELIVGVVVDNTPKCYSELDFTKDGKIDCRDDFKDALIGACHSCPIPGIFSSGATTPQIQNVAANFISPQSRPDAIVDNELLERILNDNIDKIISDFSLTLPDAMSDIAVDTVIAGFDEIDVDAIVDRLDDDIVKQLGKLEGALEDIKKELGVTGDLSEVIKKLPQFEEDLIALEDDIKAIKDDVEKVGDSIDELEKFFGFLNTAWTDFKGAIGIT